MSLRRPSINSLLLDEAGRHPKTPLNLRVKDHFAAVPRHCFATMLVQLCSAASPLSQLQKRR